jgi:pimeloyl-ACP methyl ester carboxylesterase
VTGILWILLAAGVLIVGVYVFFPQWIVATIVGLTRKWGRMSARSVEADGIRWPYLEGGPEQGATIVMLHGFGGDKDNWSLFTHYLTDRYRVIAPDLPGFGENIRNPDWAYGAAAQVERLEGFVAKLGLDAFHLTGNSMGGFIALHYALTYPERLKSLTLIDPAGVTGANKSELEIAFDEGQNLLLAASLDDMDRLLDFVMHKRIPSPKIMKKAIFEIQRRHRAFLDQVFETLKDEALNGSLEKRLGDVATPTLIIWGRHDRVIDVSCAKVMGEAIPDNRVVIFEDVGHMPMIESPRRTADHQMSLIAESETRALGG